MTQRGLNDNILWALTPEANETVNVMVANGWDRDLAVEFLAKLLPENEVFDLPERANE